MLREIARLKDSDFPHKDARFVLDQIERFFVSIKSDLDGLAPASDPSLVQTVCSESLKQLFDYHRLLGFVLRSTNVRNSFEIYGPILRLSRQVLGSNTHLVLSSEWEYSPHVYRSFSELPGTVLLGLPAAESGNPLLAALAGHELGHTVWQRKNLGAKFSKQLDQNIKSNANQDPAKYEQLFGHKLTDLFATQVLSQAHAWAAKQAEESFCDFMGVRIFGESYFHAFAYLLSPGLTTPRSFSYPPTQVRIENAARAAKQFRVNIPAEFSKSFLDSPPTLDDRVTYLLKLADAALSNSVASLLAEVDTIANAAKIAAASDEKIREAFECFKLLVPTTNAGSLVNILVAGWKAYHDADLWKEMPHVLQRKREILNELVLKSVEVFEIEQILSESP
jgi:hypothetical protein